MESDEIDDDEIDDDDDTWCEDCGRDVGLESHYHCPYCGEVCSMMGHYDKVHKTYTCVGR